MIASRAFACAVKAGTGVKVRSSLRRSEYSAAFSWVTNRKHTVPSASFQSGQAGAYEGGKVGVSGGAVAEKRAIVSDGRHQIAALVREQRQVVMRARVAGIERHGAAQELACLSRSARGFLYEAEVDE